MKIAVLGWGSLIPHPEKNGRRLEIKGDWHNDGPLLPIEYARISRTEELTLVLYPEAEDVETLWAYSAYEELDRAIENLRNRERSNTKDIGYYNKSDGSNRYNAVPGALDTIMEWVKDKDIDAVIWTDLPENFEDKDKGPYTEDKAIEYIKSLTGETRVRAIKYMRETPKQVNTPLRARINEVFKK